MRCSSMRSLAYLGLIISLSMMTAAQASLKPVAPRQHIKLDGLWQIAEGSLQQAPSEFKHKTLVPGLADMAQPPFDMVGYKNDKREAFWYRRTFTIQERIPAIALLKIHKAKYGTRVFLNGELLGDHLPCFTPSYFDLRKHLHAAGTENELIIRVGAYRESVPRSIPDGWDFEKYRYIPGIYDSVELILTEPPYFEWVQTAPDLFEETLQVKAKLLNPQAQEQIQIQAIVREAKSGKVIATDTGVIKNTKSYATYTYSSTLPLKNCRRWSPADPFLYELELRTSADAVRTRFGMRAFRFDKQSRRAVLNGEPYIMRGTNVCIYRFFEDELRGDKPWRAEWVQRLHQKFKSMHC
jgi:beta-galactosidase